MLYKAIIKIKLVSIIGKYLLDLRLLIGMIYKTMIMFQRPKYIILLFIPLIFFQIDVSADISENLQHHLIQDDHPIRDALDEIFLFSQQSVTKSDHTLKVAGFRIIRKGFRRKPFVVSHAKLPGYLLKLYTDSQTSSVGEKFLKRIEGAQVIQDLIDRYDFHQLFKIPQKWIYHLPVRSTSNNEYVLVVENMNILKKEENLVMWKSSSMTFGLLDAIYILLSEGGLWDSIYAFNIPFSYDGKIAFIDTEYYHKWPVRYRKMNKYLSKEKKKYWKLMTNQ